MKLSQAIERGFSMTQYDPNCRFYLTHDGKRASVFGCAALAVGMTPADFRAVLSEGQEDAFVYTLRSEIWYVMSQIWPWLSNDTCGQISGVEAANGYHDALACVLNHEPAEDDQLPPPKPKVRIYPEPVLDKPVVTFTTEQASFVGKSLWKCVEQGAIIDGEDFHRVLEKMAGEFERHVPGFDATDFYFNPNEKEQQTNALRRI